MLAQSAIHQQITTTLQVQTPSKSPIAEIDNSTSPLKEFIDPSSFDQHTEAKLTMVKFELGFKNLIEGNYYQSQTPEKWSAIAIMAKTVALKERFLNWAVVNNGEIYLQENRKPGGLCFAILAEGSIENAAQKPLRIAQSNHVVTYRHLFDEISTQFAGLMHFYDLHFYQNEFQNHGQFSEEILSDVVHGPLTVLSNGNFIPAAKRFIASCNLSSPLEIANIVGTKILFDGLGAMYHSVFSEKPLSELEIDQRINVLLQGICFLVCAEMDPSINKNNLLKSALEKLKRKMIWAKQSALNYKTEPVKPEIAQITLSKPVLKLAELPQFPDVIPLVKHYEAAFAELMENIPSGGIGKNKAEILLSKAKDAKNKICWASFQDQTKTFFALHDTQDTQGFIIAIPQNHPEDRKFQDLGGLIYPQDNVTCIKSVKITKEFAAVFLTMLITLMEENSKIDYKYPLRDQCTLRNLRSYLAEIAALDHLTQGSFSSILSAILKNNKLETEEDLNNFTTPSNSKAFLDILYGIDAQILPTAESKSEARTRFGLYKIALTMKHIEAKNLSPEEEQKAQIEIFNNFQK